MQWIQVQPSCVAPSSDTKVKVDSVIFLLLMSCSFTTQSVDNHQQNYNFIYAAFLCCAVSWIEEAVKQTIFLF